MSNSLLSRNLQRWAEVYFNHAPERRDQAVLDLLHELEAEQEQRGKTGSQTAEPATREANPAGTPADDGESTLIRCKTCGHDNERTQRFCGMCGTDLSTKQFKTGPHFDQGSEQVWDLQASRGNGGETEIETWEQEADSSSTGYEELVPNTNELSLFQTVPRGSDYGEAGWEYEASPRPPYRLYIGVVLAALLLGLGYMAWRSTQGATQSHEASPPPPAPVKEEAAPTPQPPEAAKASPPAATDNTAPASSKDAEAADNPAPKAIRGERLAKPTPTSQVTRVAPSPAANGKGEEELSMAERYLSGANGERRDTAAASKWLWRSVAKHNDRATLLLADMYLHGDGVAKNCDQARVLLYSAARKGMSGAGERLRNLQAFGCQ